MTTAAIYCRVSTTDQKANGTSLETQREAALAKAEELGWTVPEESIILEDWSGTDLCRPGLATLLRQADSGLIAGVIIFTLDRLYRPENEGDEWRYLNCCYGFRMRVWKLPGQTEPALPADQWLPCSPFWTLGVLGRNVVPSLKGQDEAGSLPREKAGCWAGSDPTGTPMFLRL